MVHSNFQYIKTTLTLTIQIEIGGSRRIRMMTGKLIDAIRAGRM